MNWGIVLVFLLFNAINQQKMVDAQNYMSKALVPMYMMCRSLVISEIHMRRCQNGEYLPGGPFFGEPQLTMRCTCMQLMGMLMLRDQTIRIRMLDSLGSAI